jgi:hypothetical protein
MEIKHTTIYMNPTQAKQWLMMEFLNSLGAFDIKLGRVTIDFDKDGAIGNVKIEQNYKPQKFST